ncbi:MAG TPA: HNH endonuclease family protein, partial [Candidatus Limnocylindrales bacterium]
MSRRWLLVVAGLVTVLLLATALGAHPPSAGSTVAPTTANNSRGDAAAGPATLPPASAGASTAGAATLTASASLAAPGPSAPASPPASGTMEPLAWLLAMLPIATETRTRYERSLFTLWIDADGDGCDTRHEVLIRDARIKPHVGTRCLLTGGSWLSLYDGLTFTDPTRLQIDHVIPLAEAWDSGARAWSPQEREAFANDLGVPFALLAVSATTNESKSDDDPADWLPPAPAAACPYLGDWLATKARWALTVDPREHDALASDIRACPATEMPFVPAGWPAAGSPPPAPV